MKKIPRRLAATMLVMAGVAVAGCGAQQQTGPQDGMTVAETQAEYSAEAATLSLAPEWSWPADLGLEETSEGLPVHYQRGFGTKEANYYWYCSWASRAIDAALPAPDRAQALTEVLQIREMFFYTGALDDRSRRFFESLLQKAELGDTSAMANDVQLNCPPRAE